MVSNLPPLSGESGTPYSDCIEKLNDLKSKNGNSYIYQTTFTSWSGYGSVTELKIKDGKVVSRVYQEFITNESHEREIVDSYTETKSNLGSREKGAKPLTIDDLYHLCTSEYLTVDEEDNSVTFETELDGLMTLCGFSPVGCVDDCFRGIRISALKWLH
ncbi:hypothetical protein RCC89_00865 [Cytophagaceae bacterium ABcell3]|nr:hypothetical protein RCC89_00865 [Cytophagaceae bacterium ABcell3]